MEGLVLGLREGGHLKYGFCRHKRYHIGYSWALLFPPTPLLRCSRCFFLTDTP